VPPRLTQLHQDNTHRLIPARYSEDGASVLARLTSDRQQLQDLFQLDGATNERLLGEANLLPGITVHELVFGVPNAHIVNAAFTHARPEGSRFNGPDRGAWYSAFTLDTAQDEVAFHFARSLQEVNWQESRNRDLPGISGRFPRRIPRHSQERQVLSLSRSGKLCCATGPGPRAFEPGIGGTDLPQRSVIAAAFAWPAFVPRWWSMFGKAG
jgi:hypothetical protein